MTNPFSTRYIRPGAIPYLFLSGETAGGVVHRLAEQNWWGQIIGPHGSGKSTLLASLVTPFEAAGRRVISVALHQGEHRLPTLDRSAFVDNTLLVIDGYEQLTWWSRRRVKSLCRRQSAGLLVTAHSDVGLPTIFETAPTEELACAVVACLTKGQTHAISPQEVSKAYAAANRDIRETLFKLYDVYQRLQVSDR